MNYFKKKDLKICTLNISSTIKDVITNLNNSSMQISIINSQSGNLLGVINDGDIRRGLLRGLDLSSKISSLVKKNPLVVEKNTPTKTVEYLMKTKGLLHLPVVDKNLVTIGLHSWIDYKVNEKIANPVIIMAGGFGKRLKPYTSNCPKPMLEIGGKPMLEHIINNLKSQGFRKVLISVNYLSENIINYFKTGKNFGVSIEYIKEEKPLGTLGSLGLFKDIYKKPVLVVNGDTLTNINLKEMLNFHLKNKSHATMAVKVMINSNPYGVVKSKGLLVENFQEKPIEKIYINAGVYVISNTVIDLIKKNSKIDAPKFLMQLKKKKKKVIIFPAHEEWNEIGTVENYHNIISKNQ
jgi:dTDP-glucose pyrophosphorylase